MLGTKILRHKSKKSKLIFCIFQNYTKMTKIGHFSVIWVKAKCKFRFFQLIARVPIIRKVKKDLQSVSSYIYGCLRYLKMDFRDQNPKITCFCTILGVPKRRYLHGGVISSVAFVAENNNRCC